MGWGGITPTAVASGGGGNAFSNFMSSPGGGAAASGVLGLLGGLLGGIGQGKQNDAQMAQQRQFLLQQLLASLNEGEQGRALSREQFNANQGLQREQLGLQREQIGLNSTQMDPLAQQKSRGGMALFGAMLGNARPSAISSSIPGMNMFMPQLSGGIMDLVPKGGFSPETLKYFSPESMANAEGNFMTNAAPFAQPTDLTGVGYGSAGATPTAQGQSARSSFQAQQASAQQQRAADAQSASDADFSKSAAQRAALQQAMSGANSQAPAAAAKKKSGLLGKILGVAGLASNFIPGVGPLVGAGLGAAGIGLGNR